MTLSPLEWGVLCTVAAAAVGIIGYFLKRTMNTVDSHAKEIADVKGRLVDDEDLKEIKRELKSDVAELKKELREENRQLSADVAEIKNNYIRRDDFYRTVSDLNRGIETIRDMLIKMNGGKENGSKG